MQRETLGNTGTDNMSPDSRTRSGHVSSEPGGTSPKRERAWGHLQSQGCWRDDRTEHVGVGYRGGARYRRTDAERDAGRLIAMGARPVAPSGEPTVMPARTRAQRTHGRPARDTTSQRETFPPPLPSCLCPTSSLINQKLVCTTQTRGARVS